MNSNTDDAVKKPRVATPSSGHVEDVTITTTKPLDIPDIPGHLDVSYGQNGVRGIFSSGYVFGAAALASLGGFSFGYDQGVISIINVMDQFHATAPLYISEIAPPNLRGILLVLESVSIVSGVVIAYWITYATRLMEDEVSFRLPLGLQMMATQGYKTYIFFTVWCFLAGIWAFMLVPETKGKTLEELDEEFGDVQGHAEMELMRAAIDSVTVTEPRDV
ncbi:hypothetical protein ZTR_04932 [Talaromyces verruculosus]|nr:hypothetical protein ZTR_04932 [Talaromyces verruculosus]